MSRGILLVNLGTPASTQTADVRAYLAEFLMDPHVVDLPWPLRALLVYGAILPTRPKRSAAAYRAIWDAAGHGTGSPLTHYSRTLSTALEARTGLPCALAMRYGQPAIAPALDALAAAGVTRLLLVTLYPQHAASTRTTTIEAVRTALPAGMTLDVLPPFYDRPDYIRAQAASIASHLPGALGSSAAVLSRSARAPPDPGGSNGHSLPVLGRLLRAALARTCHLLPASGSTHIDPADRSPRRGPRRGSPPATSRVWAAPSGSRPIPTPPSRTWPSRACDTWRSPARPLLPTTWKPSKKSAWRAGTRFLKPAANPSPCCPA